MKRTIPNRIASLLTAAAMTAALSVPAAMPVQAENFLFITEIRLETGEAAYDTLESDGYNVMAVGLNASVEDDAQIYLGYRYNTGAPINNIIISGDVGDSFEQDGIRYECASHIDVDAGNGGGTGCVYVTRDERAAKPLVGLDILRADAEEEQELLPIPNDGAEVVRKPDGSPADIERNGQPILTKSSSRSPTTVLRAEGSGCGRALIFRSSAKRPSRQVMPSTFRMSVRISSIADIYCKTVYGQQTFNAKSYANVHWENVLAVETASPSEYQINGGNGFPISLSYGSYPMVCNNVQHAAGDKWVRMYVDRGSAKGDGCTHRIGTELSDVGYYKDTVKYGILEQHFILIFIRSIDNINRSIAAAGGVENCMRRIL